MKHCTWQSATLVAITFGALISSSVASQTFDARVGYRWSANIEAESAKAGIVLDVKNPMNYEGIIIHCNKNSFEFSVGAISSAGISRIFIKEKMPEFKFIVDSTDFLYKPLSIGYDEHDEIWRYSIDIGSPDDLAEAISGGRDISIVGDGIEGKLPRKGQADLAKFAKACRAIQTKARICELERSMTGEFRLESVKSWADASDTGTTSFILRDSKRGRDGIVRSSIVAEFVANRMGYGIFSSAGKDLGVLVISDAKITNSTSEKCPHITTKFESPSKLAILKGGQRIGVIIDEKRLLSRKM